MKMALQVKAHQSNAPSLAQNRIALALCTLLPTLKLSTHVVSSQKAFGLCFCSQIYFSKSNCKKENVKLKAQINQLNYENQQLREMLEKKTKVNFEEDNDSYEEGDPYGREDDLLDDYDLDLGSVEVVTRLFRKYAAPAFPVS